MTRVLNGFVASDSPVDPEGVVSSNFLANTAGAHYAKLLSVSDARAGTLDAVGMRCTLSVDGHVAVPSRLIKLALQHRVPLVFVFILMDPSTQFEVLAPGQQRQEWLPAQFVASTELDAETWFEWTQTPNLNSDVEPEEYVRLAPEELGDVIGELLAGAARELRLAATCDSGVGYIVMLDPELLEILDEVRARVTFDMRPSDIAADEAYERWDRLGIWPANE